MLDPFTSPESEGDFQLLPFLDIVFALVGIFLVIFVLQSRQQPTQTGLAGVDELIICQDDQELQLYTAPTAVVQIIAAARVRELFAALPQDSGVRNLSFAFSRDCFATKRGFERAFQTFSSNLESQSTTRRLNFRPLSQDPGAAAALREQWQQLSP